MNRKSASPKAPPHLLAPTREWFDQVVAEFVLEPHHVRVLTLAAEAWDRCQEARKAIEKSGLTFSDRFGTPRARPEVAIERDARTAFARMIRELDLDVAPPATPRRPPGIQSNRRA